jgi:DNA-binding LacI/PurR family transcriptional regulator
LTFGVVVPDVTQSFYNELIRGATTRAFADNYNVVLLPSAYSAETERHYLSLLRRHMYDGLIFASHALTLQELVTYVPYGRIVICQDPEDYDIPAVYASRGSSYREALRWLQAQTNGPIGLILGRKTRISATTQATVKAYQDVFHHDLPRDLTWQGTTYQDGLTLGPQVLAKHPGGLLISSDDVAAGIHYYYQRHQQSVPVLVGQDRQLTGQLLNLPTIDHHIARLGTMAADLLISRDLRQIELPAEFIVDPE